MSDSFFANVTVFLKVLLTKFFSGSHEKVYSMTPYFSWLLRQKGCFQNLFAAVKIEIKPGFGKSCQPIIKFTEMNILKVDHLIECVDQIFRGISNISKHHLKVPHQTLGGWESDYKAIINLYLRKTFDF